MYLNKRNQIIEEQIALQKIIIKHFNVLRFFLTNHDCKNTNNIQKYKVYLLCNGQVLGNEP